MKNFKLIISSLIVVFFSCSPDDSDSPSPEDVFVKYFGVSGDQAAIDLIYNEALDQYFILGSQTLTGGNADFYYATASASGNIINQRTYNHLDSSLIDIPSAIKPLTESSYLVVGTSSNTDDDSKIVWGVIDHDLNTEATYYELSNPIDEEQDLVAADIVKIEGEDNVLIFGTTSVIYPGDQANEETAGKQLFIAKVTLTNEVIWKKTSGGVSDDIAVKAFELSNGGFGLFGRTERAEDNYSGTNVLVKFTNSLGTEDGTDAAYGFDSNLSNDDILMDVIKVGNDFKLTGTSSANGANPSAFVMGISSTGIRDTTVMKATTLSNDFGSNINTSANTIVRANNGDYMIMGSFPNFQTGDGSRLEEMMILRTDANGNKIDDKDQWYGLESGNDRANKAISLSDGKIAVLGTFDFGSGITLIGLLKLNINGELKR
ncbi:MAG: hypothetical protein JXR03_05190 [Cyclobacteriaceae bacterium]